MNLDKVTLYLPTGAVVFEVGTNDVSKIIENPNQCVTIYTRNAEQGEHVKLAKYCNVTYSY